MKGDRYTGRITSLSMVMDKAIGMDSEKVLGDMIFYFIFKDNTFGECGNRVNISSLNSVIGIDKLIFIETDKGNLQVEDSAFVVPKIIVTELRRDGAIFTPFENQPYFSYIDPRHTIVASTSPQSEKRDLAMYAKSTTMEKAEEMRWKIRLVAAMLQWVEKNDDGEFVESEGSVIYGYRISVNKDNTVTTIRTTVDNSFTGIVWFTSNDKALSCANWLKSEGFFEELTVCDK